MKVEIYSDVACPWCYIGERRFGGSIAGKLQHVTESAADEGIVIDWDKAISANTRNAHRLLGLAEREHGVEMQRRLVDALFAAHFSEGVNIADPNALTDIAAAAGMNRARVLAHLTSDEGNSELTDALRDAADIGVSSVPTFVFDGLYAVSGAQPTATFVQVLEEVSARSRVPAE